MTEIESQRTVTLGQICLVTSHDYPRSIGGEETFINQYSEILRSNGIPFKIISSSNSPRNDVLEPMYIRPFEIPFLGFEIYSLLWVLVATLGIVKLHSNHRIRLIHSVETGYGGLASVFAARLLGLPLIVHSHTMRSEGLKDIRDKMKDWRVWPYWALEKSIDKFVLNHASKAVAVSREVATFLKSLGFPESKILIVPSAVDVEKFSRSGNSKLKVELGIGNETFVIGYLGRLVQLKGVETLIDAFAKFADKSLREAVLLVAGDGPLRNRLEATAREMRINVKFLGFQSDIVGFLGSIDVFVLPSFFEGSPLALLEAMAAGCPVIASNIQSVMEIASDSILSFHAGDSSKLAELLLEVEKNSKLRASLSKSSRETSRNYSTTTAMPKILQFDLDP